MLIHARRYEESSAEYATLLETPGFMAAKLPVLAVALVSNNCAWANVMLDDPQALKFADAASAKAIDLAANNPSVLGTRGLVLIEMGKVKAGRKLLTRSLKLHRQTAARAAILASCAGIRSPRPARRCSAVVETSKRNRFGMRAATTRSAGVGHVAHAAAQVR